MHDSIPLINTLDRIDQALKCGVVGRGRWMALAVVTSAVVTACDLVLPIVEDASVGLEAGGDSPPPGTSFQCGPSLSCSLANPNIGCCVVPGMYDARAPESYGYECLTPSQCARAQGLDGGTAVEIHCDNGSECPGASPEVCCWPSIANPSTTYCFAADAGNCAYELCDPNAQTPCVNHRKYMCVPAEATLPLAPLGYYVCVPDGG